MTSWTKLVALCTRTPNYTRVLKELYEDERKELSEFESVNYKTTSRVVNEFVQAGLLGKNNENEYYLTSIGKFISYFTLGKFNSIKPSVEKGVIIDNDTVYVEREDVIEKIMYNIKREKHTLILGESGVGKTTLLKHLHENYFKEESVYSSIRPPKALLRRIVDKLELDCNKTARKNELKRAIRDYKPTGLILFLDNVELETKLTSRLVKELQRFGILVIATGQYTRKNVIRFDDQLHLRPLNDSEVNHLVNELLTQEYEPEEVTKIVLQNTSNKPESVKKICKQVRIAYENGEEERVREEVKPSNKRINLISTKSLMNFAYLLITLKYYFYGRRNYQAGYWLSTIAYMIFYIFRRWKR